MSSEGEDGVVLTWGSSYLLASILFLCAQLMPPTSYAWFEEGSLSFELAKGLPAAFVALVIGLVAAGIAYRQWQVARAKLNLDLFERRYAIFEETWGYLSSAVTEGTKRFNDPTLSNLLPQAEFLFGPEIRAYMEQARSKMGDFWVVEKEWGTGTAEEQKKRISDRREVVNWFEKQASNGCRAKFGRYLDFRQWR